MVVTQKEPIAAPLVKVKVTHSVCLCVCGEHSRSHLVLLLEAVTFSTLHLRDMLQEVGHPDGGVQLTRLVRHRLSVRFPLLVVRLDEAAGLAVHGLTVVWKEETKRSGYGRGGNVNAGAVR